MTQKQVAGYRKLCRAAERIAEKIEALEQKPSIPQTVEASHPDPPYAKHSIPVAGYADQEKIDRLRRELDRVTAEIKAIEDFVESLRSQDEELWLILDMYYLSREKPSLLAVATRIGWADESTPRKIIKNYFESRKSRF